LGIAVPNIRLVNSSLFCSPIWEKDKKFDKIDTWMAERTRRGRQKQAEMMLITMKAMILKNQN